MLMDVGCLRLGLACGRALALAGDEWAGGYGAEQDSEGERGEEDGAGDGFHHPLRQAGHTGGGAAPWRREVQNCSPRPLGVDIPELQCGKGGRAYSGDRGQLAIGEKEGRLQDLPAGYSAHLRILRPGS